MKLSDDELRLDRWLFFARFYKTRAQATAAAAGGHAKIGGERASPGDRVRCGDVIDLVRERVPYRLIVTAIPCRRGPASEARLCYDEDPEIEKERQAILKDLRQDRLLMPRTDGRPDKHTRRILRARNREQN